MGINRRPNPKQSNQPVRKYRRKPKSLRNLRLGPWFTVGEVTFVKFRVAREYAAERGLPVFMQCSNGVTVINSNNTLDFYQSILGVSTENQMSPFVLSEDEAINIKAFSPWLDF